jgi:phosphoglucosamine mutase
MNPILCGVLPTPGVAWLTSAENAAAGISISASHNPYFDNGLKIFNSEGFKLSDEEEVKIETRVLNDKTDLATTSAKKTGCVDQIDTAAKRYATFLVSTLTPDCSFKGMKIVLDCANGATSRIAPGLFSGLGADVTCLFDTPNGKNINANCGSEHPEVIIQTVVKTGADIGIAFDGDGDRLVVVDETGNILSGDQLLAIFAGHMNQQKTLKDNVVVSTVMSNIGLGLALKRMGIQHFMADVGDRRVLEKMQSVGAVFGGENSGHMIFLNHHTTGDGMLSALQLIRIMRTAAKPLSELSQVMTVYPQALMNVSVKKKPALNGILEVQKAIKSVEKKLGDKGRVLVRYSGTQPLCRVMVEGPTLGETEEYCHQIAGSVRDALG